jgi:hypothetical protein
MLDDYGWEKKKRRGLSTELRPGIFGMRSEQAEYTWYSRGRYLVIVLLTYLNSVGLISASSGPAASADAPVNAAWAFSAVIVFSILLIMVDDYWDQWRRDRLSRGRAFIFWLYFWLRYPVLIIATIIATRRGLQP